MIKKTCIMPMVIIVFSLLIIPVFAISATVTESCILFHEDFSGLSQHTWSYSEAMQILNEKLSLSQPNNDNFAIGETSSFLPSGPFFVDMDVETDIHDEDTGFGIYPFTGGDIFLNVNGQTADGVGVFVFPNLSTTPLCKSVTPSQGQICASIPSIPKAPPRRGANMRQHAIPIKSIKGSRTYKVMYYPFAKWYLSIKVYQAQLMNRIMHCNPKNSLCIFI